MLRAVDALFAALLAIPVGIASNLLVDWFRADAAKRAMRLLVTAVAVLTGAGIVGAILIDRNWNSEIDNYPLTANLAAGLLGLPAAFLIVNIAAEHTVKMAGRARWSKLRQSELKEARSYSTRVRDDLIENFHLEKSSHELEPNFWSTFKDFSLELKALDLEISKHKDTSIILATMNRLIGRRQRLVDGATEVLETGFKSSRHAERLIGVVLPRLEESAEDPDIVLATRACIDSLIDLDSEFDDRQSLRLRLANLDKSLEGAHKVSDLHVESSAHVELLDEILDIGVHIQTAVRSLDSVISIATQHAPLSRAK